MNSRATFAEHALWELHTVANEDVQSIQHVIFLQCIRILPMMKQRKKITMANQLQMDSQCQQAARALVIDSGSHQHHHKGIIF